MTKTASTCFNTLNREFLFTQKDFEQVRQLIYDHAGINLSDAKKDLVYSRLGRRLRANQLKHFSDYINLLSNKQSTEWQAFINALTTNLTSFFRETYHFPMLAAHINTINRRPINIWCNAASTGEEPYTIAMTMMDLFGSLTPPVRIIATDIDTNALEKAKNGIYTIEQAEKLPHDTLQRFFLKGRGENTGYIKVRKELRDLVEFSQLNLHDDIWFNKNGVVQEPFDAIFCRNVMIYFDKPTQHKILQKIAPIMHKDGLLFVGHSESLQGLTNTFTLQGKTVYSLSAQNLSSTAHLKTA